MKPIERISTTDRIISELRNAIGSGEYGIGDKLPTEAEISAQLGVGRSSVREALRYLQALELLEAKPGKGFFVSKPTGDSPDASRWFRNHELDVRDILEARRAIEPRAAHLAAIRRTDAEVEQIRSIDREFRAAMAERNTARLVKADEAFHSLIVKASRNKLYMKFHQSLTDHNERYRIKCFSFEDTIEHSVSAHRRISEAVAAEDPDAAEREMAIHLETVQVDLGDSVNTAGT